MQKTDASKYPIGSSALSNIKTPGDTAPSYTENSAANPTRAPIHTSIQESVSKFLNFKFGSLEALNFSHLDGHKIIEAASAAADKSGYKHYEMSFRFAQHIQGIPGATGIDPCILKPVVEAFYLDVSAVIDLGMSFDDFWLKFLADWVNVHTPINSNPLREAFRRAREQRSPITIPGLPPEKDFQLLARVADELSKGRKWFYLQQNEIAAELGCKQPRVSSLLKILGGAGVIRIIYHGTGPRDGHRYVVGPALLALRDQPTQLKLVVSNDENALGYEAIRARIAKRKGETR